MDSSASVEPGNPYASPRASLARRPARSHPRRWWSALGTVLARTWVAFSVAAFAVAVLLGALVERENFLESDDPYIPGLIVGVFCAGLALLRSLAEVAGASVNVRRLVYFAALAAVVVFLVGYDLLYVTGEGDGILTLFGGLIALIGAAVYPFVAARPGKLYLVLASIPGVLFVAGYFHVIMAMAASR